MERDGANKSLWQDTINKEEPVKAAVPADLYDVIIAGAGITGITTGLLLQKAGLKVLIAEAHTAGFGTSGGTTAHLNTFMDTTYDTMIRDFGKEHATGVAEAIAMALRLIRNNVQEYNIDCGYRELPAYLYATEEDQLEDLEKVYTGAQEVNVAVERATESPVPIPFLKVLQFPGQATFHPTRYLMALLSRFRALGGVLLENCRITSIDEAREMAVHTDTKDFRANHFIYATHIPPGVNVLHFRCAPYRSYAMAVKLNREEDYPRALAYDMRDIYHYFRTQEVDGVKYLIAGGEDHKTGHEEHTETRFTKLEAYIRSYFPVEEVVYKWSSQYFEPVDGLPYIGHLPGAADNVYVATGYGGNGMVYSAVAALTLAGMVTGEGTPFERLFNPNRIKPVAGFTSFVKEAADVVGLLGSKLISPPDLDTLADLAPGEAKVIKHEGRRLAVFKEESGKVHVVEAACTHIQCEVAWNQTERTWDCPCHGSRFDINGKVLTAPARKDLKILEWAP